ncbi:MAG: hypothetical protein ACK56F_33230, partial [bacterium]
LLLCWVSSSGEGPRDGVAPRLQLADPLQQVGEARDLASQHPRVGHGLKINLQGLTGGVDRPPARGAECSA